MAACKDGDLRVRGISSAIRVVPNFPKPGIMFQDVTTLLLDPKAFRDAIDIFVDRYKDKEISVVAGIEARGFLFGPPIALAIGAKFVPMRKPRKLPGEVIAEEYVLEYGADRLEMHVGAVQPGERALIVDDVIATGGTLCAAIKLLERAGAEVVECACVIELPALKLDILLYRNMNFFRGAGEIGNWLGGITLCCDYKFQLFMQRVGESWMGRHSTF